MGSPERTTIEEQIEIEVEAASIERRTAAERAEATEAKQTTHTNAKR